MRWIQDRVGWPRFDHDIQESLAQQRREGVERIAAIEQGTIEFERRAADVERQLRAVERFRTQVETQHPDYPHQEAV